MTRSRDEPPTSTANGAALGMLWRVMCWKRFQGRGHCRSDDIRLIGLRCNGTWWRRTVRSPDHAGWQDWRVLILLVVVDRLLRLSSLTNNLQVLVDDVLLVTVCTTTSTMTPLTTSRGYRSIGHCLVGHFLRRLRRVDVSRGVVHGRGALAVILVVLQAVGIGYLRLSPVVA